MRGDDSIQYTPVSMPEIPESQPPGWLEKFGEWLAERLAPLGEFLGVSWPILQWVLYGLLALIVIVALFFLLRPLLERGPGRKKIDSDDAGWVPQREEALALLEDADRLAAQGQYDEATHLLLQRSVQQIASARPDWVEPSSTARELAALPALPDRARDTFGIIAARVERSLFALRSLGKDDWDAARTAYADFALERIPHAGASA